MELENRYFVVKRYDVIGDGQAKVAMDVLARIVERSRENRNAAPLECLVIEKDWPEYEAVLKMLSDRVEINTHRLTIGESE